MHRRYIGNASATRPNVGRGRKPYVRLARLSGVRLLPEPGPARTLALSTLVNTVGRGTWLTASALFLTRSVGLTVAQVGLALTITALVSLVASHARWATSPTGTGPRGIQLAALLASGGLHRRAGRRPVVPGVPRHRRADRGRRRGQPGRPGRAHRRSRPRRPAGAHPGLPARHHQRRHLRRRGDRRGRHRRRHPGRLPGADPARRGHLPGRGGDPAPAAARPASPGARARPAADRPAGPPVPRLHRARRADVDALRPAQHRPAALDRRAHHRPALAHLRAACWSTP